MPSWSLVQTLKFTAISNEYIFPNIHSLPSHFVKYFHQISSNNGPHELKHWGGKKLLGFAPFLWPLPPSPECSGSEAKACWERCRPTGWRRSSGCRGRCLVCGAAQWSRDAAGADSHWAAAAAACSGMMDRRDIIGRSHVFFLYMYRRRSAAQLQIPLLLPCCVLFIFPSAEGIRFAASGIKAALGVAPFNLHRKQTRPPCDTAEREHS